MEKDTFIYSKNGQRKVGGFFAQELLYDHVTSQLDPDRKAAVEEFVASSKEAQQEIQQINMGMKYLEKLSEIRVSDAVSEHIMAPSSYIQVLLRKLHFDDWSPGIKMGLEVVVVAIGVISISLVIPWHRFTQIRISGSKEIVLAEVNKSSPEFSDLTVAAKTEDETQIFPDEGYKKSEPELTQVVAIPAPEKKPEPPPAPAPIKAVVAKVEPVPKKPEPKTIPAPAPTAVVAAESATDGAEPGPKKSQGFLYRGVIRVTNVSAVSPKFVEKISELGGRKAGGVELGWKKGDSAYFHMTMPEAKYQMLLDFAKDYGTLSLQKEKHDRVMPDGIMRVIFTIEEKK